MFSLKPKKIEINWKLLGTINPDKLLIEKNNDELMDVIDMITRCNVDKEDFGDQNLIKLFKLAQICSEYLLYQRDTNESELNRLQVKLKELESKSHLVSSTKTQQSLELDTLKKENKMLKKTVYAYQMAHKLPGNTVSSYYKCEFCPKSFTSDNYLEAHVKRRHGDCLSEFYEGRGEFKVKKTDPILEKISDAISTLSNQIVATDNQVKDLKRQNEQYEQESFEEKLEKRLELERSNWFKQWQDIKADIITEIKDQDTVKVLDDSPEIEDLKEQVFNLKKSLNLKSRSRSSSTSPIKHKSMKSVDTSANVHFSSRHTSNPNFKNDSSFKATAVEHKPVDIQEGEQEIIEQQPVEYNNDVQWTNYENILKKSAFSPLQAKPWIKSFYKHSESVILDEKPVLLKDINKNLNLIENNSDRLFYKEMREHLENELQHDLNRDVTKPKLTINTSPDQKDSGLPTPKSFSPKKITWRDYRGDKPPSPLRTLSPLKKYEDEEWSDEE